jgi:hypothetical protein
VRLARFHSQIIVNHDTFSVTFGGFLRIELRCAALSEFPRWARVMGERGSSGHDNVFLAEKGVVINI